MWILFAPLFHYFVDLPIKIYIMPIQWGKNP